MFKGIFGFFHKHPGIKTTVVGAGTAAGTLAAQGALGPKAAVIVAAISAILSLFIKRPQDGAGLQPAALPVPQDPPTGALEGKLNVVKLN